MPDDLTRLVADVAAATGTEPPAVLGDDAPTLAHGDGPLYLVGLIGGKEVGKTSLANALVGRTLSTPVGHGEGTATAIAYCHASAADRLRPLLDDATGGRFEVVTHDVADLATQVLVDLPDIDSRHADHLALTRRVLRHLLFPVWVQSVEKYADRRPQELLAQVAEGNDPANFLFVLNKADQLIDREGLDAAGELAADYAGRLQKLLGLPDPPDVHLVSAERPGQYDLPRLRARLAKQRERDDVERSRALAVRRRDKTLLAWVAEQDLPGRADRAERLAVAAAEQVQGHVLAPLLTRAIPRLADDPATRAAAIEPAVAARLRRWPIVNALDALLGPVVALVRLNLHPAPAAATPGGAAHGVDAHLAGRPLARRVQDAFARLRQSHPEVADAYRGNKLWEDLPADLAAADFSDRLADALDAERSRGASAGTVGAASWLLAPVRWLLTVGAAVWFPFGQPVLRVVVTEGRTVQSVLANAAALAVEILSAQYLLTTLGFLAVYFLALWAWLRFDAFRRASRRLASHADDPTAAPAAAATAWAGGLLAPLRDRAEAARELAARAEALSDVA